MEQQKEKRDTQNDLYSYTSEEYQTMEEKNKLKENYAVALDCDGKPVDVPPYCTCCMKETEKFLTISRFNGGFGSTGTTLSFNFPLCSGCMQHYYKAVLQKRKAFFLPLLSLALFGALLLLGFNVYLSGLTLINSHIVLYILFDNLLKMPQLEPEHSAMKESVQIARYSYDLTTVTFVFTNWLYATLFARANGTAIRKPSARNKKRRRSVLSNANHFRRYFGSLAITLAAGVVIWLIVVYTAYYTQ